MITRLGPLTIYKVLPWTDRVTKTSGHLRAVGNGEIMKSSTQTEIRLFGFPCHNKKDKASVEKGQNENTGTYCFRVQFMSVLRQNFIHAGLVNICDKPESPKGKKYSRILENSMDSLWDCKTELRKINKQMAAVC